MLNLSSIRRNKGIWVASLVVILLLVFLINYGVISANRDLLNLGMIFLLFVLYTIHYQTKKELDNKLYSFKVPNGRFIYDPAIKDILRDECRAKNKDRTKNVEKYDSPIIRYLKKNGRDFRVIRFKYIMLSIVIPVLLSFSASYLDKGSYIASSPSKFLEYCVFEGSESDMVQQSKEEDCLKLIRELNSGENGTVDWSYMIQQTFIIVIIVLITVEFGVLLSLNDVTYSGVRSIMLMALALDICSLIAVSALEPPDWTGDFGFATSYFLALCILTLWVSYVSSTIIALAKRLDDRYGALCDLILAKYDLGPVNQIGHEKASGCCNYEEL